MTKRSDRRERSAARHLLEQSHRAFCCPASQAGKAGDGSGNQFAHARGDMLISFRPGVRRVLAIPGEKLVSADAREQHGGLLSRLAAHQVRRNDRRIGGGFVHVPGEARQQIGHVRLDHDALILAAQTSCQPGGHFGIVERVFADPILRRKRDGVSAHRLTARPAPSSPRCWKNRAPRSERRRSGHH